MLLQVLKYQIQPLLSFLFFIVVVQYLCAAGQGKGLTVEALVYNNAGNYFSWKFTLVVLLWSFLSMKVQSRIICGPACHFGFRPIYNDNGLLYCLLTSLCFLFSNLIFPQLSVNIFNNMPHILGALNTTGLLLCLYLLLKGRYLREHNNDKFDSKSFLFDFFTGVELHPRIWNADVKQWVICRVGMMLWLILICAFYITRLQTNGFSMSFTVNIILQVVYIFKFFWWEGGYFSTLDMMYERAGYYLIWGTMVFVPALYTYSSYYLVLSPESLSPISSIVLCLIGLTAIGLNYKVDYERQIFRSSSNYNVHIWGKPATYILAKYTDESGNERTTGLLTSGYWGVARRLSYTFELLSALSWCACGYGLGVHPFLYFIFLTLLLLFRTKVDEERCKKKYGSYWEAYCKKVPYVFIPLVW